ncbi:MAG TPA: FAD-binding oxidoreductase [Acidimicrobiales bacterium]|nr:FAD-binding oxidoreductase [Acidimicrobiales bacterium]
MAAPPLDPQLQGQLVDIVGAPHVLVDPEVVAGYLVDWTRRFHGDATAVVRPGDAAEVAATLAACRRAGVAVVPQGGNTGLVGGAIAYDGALTLSLTRLREIGPVDAITGQVDVAAGTTLADLQAHARESGWRFAVDLTARASATIGGMTATNAGGLHVMRWGPMRSQLTGVKAATTAGTIVGDQRGLLKDNTGYHLPSILCGSEGTLAVVTSARLRLVAPTSSTAVALLGFSSVDDTVRAAGALRYALDEISAIELMVAEGVELVRSVYGGPPPFTQPSNALLLVEASGADGVVERLAEAVASLEHVDDVAVGETPDQRARLWRYREAHTEAISTYAGAGAVHKLDVTLPPAALASFMSDARALVLESRPNAQVWLFGHAGDGNIHVNITGVAEDDEGIDELVLRTVAERGGSISAEHGIGRAKRRWLHLNRSTDEIAMFTAIKRAFDPEGILNPGVILDASR